MNLFEVSRCFVFSRSACLYAIHIMPDQVFSSVCHFAIKLDSSEAANPIGPRIHTKIPCCFTSIDALLCTFTIIIVLFYRSEPIRTSMANNECSISRKAFGDLSFIVSGSTGLMLSNNMYHGINAGLECFRICTKKRTQYETFVAKAAFISTKQRVPVLFGTTRR